MEMTFVLEEESPLDLAGSFKHPANPNPFQDDDEEIDAICTQVAVQQENQIILFSLGRAGENSPNVMLHCQSNNNLSQLYIIEYRHNVFIQ